MIEMHETTVVDTGTIELDADIWNAVRTVIDVSDEGAGPSEEIVFPVVARDGRLVLLARFELFISLRDAGAEAVKAYRIEWDGSEPLSAYAIAMSM